MNKDCSESKMKRYQSYLKTPVGWLQITACDEGVLSVYFTDQAGTIDPNAHTLAAQTQLADYFSGERTTFDLSLKPRGTAFQQSVWLALMTVDYAKTCSYQDIANQLNNSNAVRAVGAANGRNPISIIVPCHRVIGSNGALTGYAGGIDRKAWLLKHEGSLLF